MSREEARKRLRERVDQAVDLYPRRIDSQDELAKTQQDEKKWRAYNRELLCRIFTTEEYAHDYDNSCVPIHQVGDRYFDVGRIGDSEARRWSTRRADRLHCGRRASP